MSQSPLILVDGSSYLYRAYHALPPLTNPAGEPTGAVYGVVNMLRKLLAEHHPSHIAVIFDGKEKTFRHDLYPEYKAHRPPMPDDLRLQIEPVHALIKAMGIPLIVADSGAEADDVIGTLTHQAQTQGWSVLISTSDKDMAQLVNDKVTCVNTMTGDVMGPNEVKEKFGVRPDQIIDYLALMGDASDNVPGVAKVGPKTASKWLNEYETLENIIQNAATFPGKIGENLRTAIPSLGLSKTLVTINTELDLNISFENLQMQNENIASLKQWFTRLNFKTWLKALSDKNIPSAESINFDPQNYVNTVQNLNDWIQRIESAGLVSIILHRSQAPDRSARILGIACAISAEESCYIPYQLSLENSAAIKKILEDQTLGKITYQSKHDFLACWNENINLQGIEYDVLLESYMNSATSHRHDFETIVSHYAEPARIYQGDFDMAACHSMESARQILQAHTTLWPILFEKKGPQWVFENIEMPLTSVLAKMEYEGVLIDEKILKEQSKVLGNRIEQLQTEIFQITGEIFNVDSPKQLQWILFDKMGIEPIEKTPTGQPSTAENVLQILALEHELPHLILEYRSLRKLKSTYTDKLPLQINPETGRIHTTYHQAITSTGRLSSSDPNLQNIPIKNQLGRDIRKAFVASEGYQLVAIDYSQIELRVIAHLSNDPTLKKAFHDDLDVHAATAAEVFEIPLNQVTSDMRRKAKAINFGLMYGMSSFGLAKQIGVSKAEAQAYIDLYFKRYPGVHSYMESMRTFAQEHGYVETLWGRRLEIPDIKASQYTLRMAAERLAINAPMQGTAADIIKRAMINIHQWIQNNQSDVKMIMQVHDELVFEVKDNVVETAKTLANLMENAITLSVPLAAHIGIGYNWDQAH